VETLSAARQTVGLACVPPPVSGGTYPCAPVDQEFGIRDLCGTEPFSA
jgi:hypothetical protein